MTNFVRLTFIFVLSCLVERSAAGPDLTSLTEFLAKTSFLFPKKYQCATEEILKFVQPESYRSTDEIALHNNGVIEHFQALIDQHPCFRSRVINFWTEANRKVSNIGGGKPLLGEETGAGRFRNLENGWLWKLALKHAHDNPRAALTLLAICMHDDNGIKLRLPAEESERRGILIEKIKDDESHIGMYKKALDQSIQDSDDFKKFTDRIATWNSNLNRDKENLKNGLFPKEKIWRCPHWDSAVFATGAVSRDLNLPTEFIAKIRSLQRPKGGSSPAKNYHFVGAAYLGCQLASCRIPSESIGRIAGHLARAYRLFRLCPKLTALKAYRSELAVKLKTDPFAEDFRKFAIASFPSASPEVEAKLDEIDAEILYEKRFVGGPNSLLPCLPIKLSLAKFGSPMPRSPSSEKRPFCEIETWSEERCRRAERRLASWETDSEWTELQHTIGAEFGAKICALMPVTNSVESELCNSAKDK